MTVISLPVVSSRRHYNDKSWDNHEAGIAISLSFPLTPAKKAKTPLNLEI